MGTNERGCLLGRTRRDNARTLCYFLLLRIGIQTANLTWAKVATRLQMAVQLDDQLKCSSLPTYKHWVDNLDILCLFPDL